MSFAISRTRTSTFAGLAAASLVVAAAPTVAWAHGSHPDLRPTEVSALAWADPAGTLPAAVTIANRGGGTAPRSTLHLYLSTDKKLGKHDAELRGSVGVPALHAGKHVTTHPDLALPKGARLGRFWLLACVSGHCATSKAKVHVTPTPKTSTDLIDAAHLSKGTKILYEVYAALGDPRLPSAYRGDNPALFGDLALRDAQARWSVLTKHERALISPYLQAPSGPQGWSTSAALGEHATAGRSCEHHGPRRMDHVDSPDNRIRIWYEDTSSYDAKVAPGLARDATKIYQAFVKLMGRELPSDAGVCGFNGGDGHYDVYILDSAEFGRLWRGFAVTPDYYEGGGPAYTAFSSAPDKIELAHELFHAFQFAFKRDTSIDDYHGFDEGSADWAATYVYPRNYLALQEITMLTYPGDRTFPDNGYGYELWAFDLYLTKTFGDQLMRKIYLQFGQQPELAALNTVIPGGWESGLAEFTRYGWNQPPVKGGFRAWDDFDAVPWVTYEQPLKPMDLHLGELDSRTLNLPDKLTPLARRYYPLHVDDHHIRDLVFRNTVHSIDGASVQAFVKLNDGTWHTQDWTNKKSVEFCRDKGPDQDVTDLVIMYGNARYQDTAPLKPSKQPTLELRSNCDRYYRVTSVTGSYHEAISVPDTGHGYACTDSGTADFSLTVDPAGHSAATDGSYTPHGAGIVIAPTQLTGTRDYHQTCSGGPTFLEPCHADLSEAGGYAVNLGEFPFDDDPVSVQIQNPHHQDPFDEACDDEGYGWFNSDNPPYLDAGTVPEATLDGTAPFTVTGSNDDDDGAGHTYSTTMTVTLQPTDADGVPLQ